MAIITNTSDIKNNQLATSLRPHSSGDNKAVKLDPKLHQARELISRGEYQRALAVLPAASRHLEVRNTCAVCFIRMHRFKDAIDLLRTVSLNTRTNEVRNDVPDHIRINFAIALFYGGQPSGALDAIREIDREQDPSIVMLREQVRI